METILSLLLLALLAVSAYQYGYSSARLAESKRLGTVIEITIAQAVAMEEAETENPFAPAYIQGRSDVTGEWLDLSDQQRTRYERLIRRLPGPWAGSKRDSDGREN